MDLLKVADRHWSRVRASALQWKRGRDVLRDLCAAPHSEVNATISKLWLVGRSHSASLDRTHVGRLPLVYEKAAAKLGAIGLDGRLRAIRNCGDAYDRKHVGLIEEAVADVTMALWKVTKQWKLSLASKYLHYHAASIPMYDQISRRVYREFTSRAHKNEIETRSDAYGYHIARFLTIRSLLMAHGVRSVNARTIDDFAINLRLRGNP